MGNPAAIELDPGVLYVAPLGTTLPTARPSVQASPFAGFRALGFTENGTTMTPYKPNFAKVNVEELIYPVRYAIQDAEGMIDAMLAEITRTNTALANNLGANAVNDTTTLTPVVPGSELNVVVMWESALLDCRWVFPSCINTAALGMPRRKAPNKALIPVNFMIVQAAGLFPWYCYPSATGQV